jgi:hypothetical protein
MKTTLITQRDADKIISVRTIILLDKKYLLFSYDIGYLYSGSNTKVLL